MTALRHQVGGYPKELSERLEDPKLFPEQATSHGSKSGERLKIFRSAATAIARAAILHICAGTFPERKKKGFSSLDDDMESEF